MPNIWTHILFCNELVDTIECSHRFSGYEAYLKLGAQGPDPFFYYNFWPWVKNEPVHDIGAKLHTKNCGNFVMDLIVAAKEKDENVRAYVFGFVTHHILDRNTHPYIHYHAGYEGSDHQKLEVLIDTIMMQKYANLKTWKVPVYKEIDVGSTLDMEIVCLLDTSIKTHYPEIEPNSTTYIKKSYKDMKLALKILSDPYGWKNTLLRSLISAYSHQPIKHDRDYLNLEKKTWHHSATNKAFTESFLDLYNQGKREGIDIMVEVIKYWYTNNTRSKQKLSERIGHISFDTGMPLSLNLKNKYSEPIV